MEKKKGTPVTIHMKTTIRDQGRTEKIEFVATGQLFIKERPTTSRLKSLLMGNQRT